MRRGLFVAVVAGVVVLATRRRFRRQVSAAVRLPFALALAVLAMPLDILDDLWGGVTGIADSIKQWVLGVVHHLENIVSGWIGDLWDDISSVGNWVAGLFDTVMDFARSLVDAVYGFIRSVFDQLVHWAEQAIGAVWGFARSLFDTIVHWAEQAIGDVWNWLSSLPKWIWDNVVTPLWDAVQWVWHEVVEPAVRWLTGLIGDLGDWVRGLFKWLVDQLGTVFDFLFGWAERLLHVVEKCFDWLVMLATHGPGWVVDQVTQFFHRAPQWLAHELGAVMAKEGPSVEAMLSDWLK